MGHKYSDGCVCPECTATFNKALFAAVDRYDAVEKKKKKIKKCKYNNKVKR